MDDDATVADSTAEAEAAWDQKSKRSANNEQDVVQWIEAIAGSQKGDASVAEWLKSGVVLCDLVNAIQPGLIRTVNQQCVPFKQMENITKFLNAARELGLPESSMFDTPDLYEEKNVDSVITCIYALGGAVQTVRPEFTGAVAGGRKRSRHGRHGHGSGASMCDWQDKPKTSKTSSHLLHLDPAQVATMREELDTLRESHARLLEENATLRKKAEDWDALIVAQRMHGTSPGRRGRKLRLFTRSSTGPGASGVLRCACAAMPELTDCTESCKLVDGWTPGNASFQLSSFAAGAACDGERMLVTDNSNWRVQALNCSSGTVSCTVETVVKGLKWPLGIASIGGKLLVTLDEGIVELKEGSFSSWSSKGDTGFLCQGDGRILVASGGDGHVWSFDPACDAHCKGHVVWNSTGTGARSGATGALCLRDSGEIDMEIGVPFATRLAFSAGTVQRDVQRLQPRHGAASRSAQVPQSLRSRSDAIGIVSLALGLRAGVRGRCRSSVRAGDDLRSFLLGEEPKEKEKPAAPAEPEKPAKPASTPAPKAAAKPASTPAPKAAAKPASSSPASSESAAAKKHLQDALHEVEPEKAPEWAKLNETFALLDSDGNGHISKDGR
eukprot:g32620.t1